MSINTFIIIVNWNNPTDTIACLESLKLAVNASCQILVIDNASTDDSSQRLDGYIKTSSQIELIKLSQNMGFAGGNNVGIKLALERGCDYVLLLNNDTIVPHSFLDDLLVAVKNDSNLGVLGCKIYHYPQEDKVWFNGGRIDYVLGYATHHRDTYEGLRECDFVTGCLMLIPAKVLKEVGGFDERYFLIAEDSDLSQRIKKAGYKVAVDGRVHIYHKISATMGGFYSPVTQYYFHRNRMVFMMSLLNPIERIAFLLFQFVCVIPAWSLLEICKGKGCYVLWAWRGYRDFVFNRLGKARYFT